MKARARSLRHPFGLGGLGEFRPDFLPVLGAKVATGDCAVGGEFDGDAPPNRNRPRPRSPLGNQLRRHLQGGR